jgi:CubicO group peptidase (beta-lactamase class C family)
MAKRIRSLCIGSIAVGLLGGIVSVSAQQKPNPGVDNVFSDQSKTGSPGCALGIYRDGKVIYAKGYGLANLEENVAITPQSVFDVGSVSKQFTAASIVLLEQQGKVRLDDDVRKYIPELPDYSQYRGSKITLLHLLNHTSGLRDYVSLFFLAGINFDNVTTNEDARAIIVRQKGLNFSPGTNWQYSGSGYLLLSLVVERVSGKSLREFAAENIFRPLGMTQTVWRSDHTSLMPHRVVGYDRNDKGEYVLSVSYGEETGDGMVHTTIEDLQKWDENFYSGQVGGKDFAPDMEEPAKLTDGTVVGYAKGLVIDNYRALPTIWHGGASAGYRAYLVRVPGQHFSVACLCNVANARPWIRGKDIVDLYLADHMKPEQDHSRPDLTPEQVKGLIGLYQNPKNGDVLHVIVTDGKLQADFGNGPNNLQTVTTNLFHLVDYRPFETSLKFEPAHDVSARQFIVNTADELPARFEIVDELKISPAELSAYSGDYWSDELHATYRLAINKENLWLTDLIGGDGLSHANIIPFAQLRPVRRDEFELSGANLVFRFAHDKKGEVTGFALNGFRERGILFARMRDKN